MPATPRGPRVANSLDRIAMLDRAPQDGMRARPLIAVGGLDVTATTIAEAARDMIDDCLGPRRSEPIVSTSINGQAIALCAGDPAARGLFREADVVHCDGQPLVILSRLIGSRPFPERVATTDLFPAVARLAAAHGATFYMYGATEAVNRAAVERTRAAYPGLAIVGASHGYLSEAEEQGLVAEIARLRPDILWVALGVPREQLFCRRHRAALAGVGVIKTAGGLFDFLAGARRRAPVSLQRIGLEWLFRLGLEPRRLFMRYLLTNPRALLAIVRTLR